MIKGGKKGKFSKTEIGKYYLGIESSFVCLLFAISFSIEGWMDEEKEEDHLSFKNFLYS